MGQRVVVAAKKQIRQLEHLELKLDYIAGLGCKAAENIAADSDCIVDCMHWDHTAAGLDTAVEDIVVEDIAVEDTELVDFQH